MRIKDEYVHINYPSMNQPQFEKKVPFEGMKDFSISKLRNSSFLKNVL